MKEILFRNVMTYMAVMVLFLIGSFLPFKNGENMIVSMMAAAVLLGLLVLGNLVLSIIKFSKEDSVSGKAYLISLLLVLLVGFPLCFGAGLLSIAFNSAKMH